ncbi:flagellar protein FliT [Ramlibacter alkalitolerans]|uniref:Flagellar protein FliT n=2 Tax=Ramlibacter alkalitolerans TaxID=2039631 RepID=A0ABS1JL67_9BURK|nr:flagellar protein FliT [Ramlibacter alkalitolerans]
MLESASEEMLRAARCGDWDSVCRLEAACTVVIAKLRSLAQEQPLAVHEQRERLRILCAIVENDAAIRRIAQPVPGVIDFAPRACGAAGVTLH